MIMIDFSSRKNYVVSLASKIHDAKVTLWYEQSGHGPSRFPAQVSNKPSVLNMHKTIKLKFHQFYKAEINIPQLETTKNQFLGEQNSDSFSYEKFSHCRKIQKKT